MSADAMEWLRLSIALAAFFVSLAAFAYARRDKNSDAQKTALQKIEGRVAEVQRVGDDRHAENLRRLETINSHLSGMDERLKHMPNHSDLSGLQNSIGLLGQAVAKLQGAQEASTRMGERMNDFLMKGAGS